MAKKIRLTEDQLKNIMKVVKEDTYDQAFSTHQKEKEKEIFMSREDAKLLNTLSKNWCEDKVNHPDCEELEDIAKKLKLDRL